MYQFAGLLGKDERRLFFLKSKTLAGGIKYFFVMFTGKNFCLRKPRKDLTAPGMLTYPVFHVYYINHLKCRFGFIQRLMLEITSAPSFADLAIDTISSSDNPRALA